VTRAYCLELVLHLGEQSHAAPALKPWGFLELVLHLGEQSQAATQGMGGIQAGERQRVYWTSVLVDTCPLGQPHEIATEPAALRPYFCLFRTTFAEFWPSSSPFIFVPESLR